MKEFIRVMKGLSDPTRVKIIKILSLIVGGFLQFFFLPMDNARFTNSIIESLALAKWYVQELDDSNVCPDFDTAVDAIHSRKKLTQPACFL